MKNTIEQIQQLAISLGGSLLSTEYKHSKKSLLQWECGKGHTWVSCLDNVKNHKTWCPTCNGLKEITSSDIISFIDTKYPGAKLISFQDGCGTRKKVNLQCQKGHLFTMQVLNFLHNKCWCQQCSKNKKPTIEEIRQLAISRNGILLSTIYINNIKKLKWKCKEGHIWEARYDRVKNGNSWCPQCKSNKTEKQCRTIFNNIYKQDFPSVRIPNLNTKTNFELDGYNEELKIAFEYNGYQHYKYPNFFHADEAAFIKQQASDQYKKQYCIDNNITLIIIPYTIKQQDIKQFILERLPVRVDI